VTALARRTLILAAAILALAVARPLAAQPEAPLQSVSSAR
jgi:hypothetical protein